MSNLKVTLVSKGVQELLKSAEMQSLLEKEAYHIREATGDSSEYAVSKHVGKKRANASVIAISAKARRDCMKNNTLLKAVRR